MFSYGTSSEAKFIDHHSLMSKTEEPRKKSPQLTSPSSGQASTTSLLALFSSCLPLRASVRRTRALYYDLLKQCRLIVMNLHRIVVKALPALASSAICLPILYNNHSARASYEIHSSSTWADSRMMFRERSHQSAVTTGSHEHIDSFIYLAQSQIPSTSTHLIIFFGGAGDSSVSETVKTLASALQKRYRSSGLGSEKVFIKYFPWDEEAASTNAVREHLKGFPNSSIILVGHSYGGDTAFKVADKLEKDIRIRLLVTLDPVGHYYGINSNIDCRPDYPSGSGRKSEEERQCELQRSQRKKPASTDKWINVWAKRASTLGDLVSSAGGRWNGQANADQDIPMDLAHGEASRMYSEAESIVLGVINQNNSVKKHTCQQTVDRVIASIRTSGAKLTSFSISKGAANDGREGNPTSRSDELHIILRDSSRPGPQPVSETLFHEESMKKRADDILLSCSNTAIVDFGLYGTEFGWSYFVDSNGRALTGRCIDPDRSRRVVRWGEQVCL